MATATVSDDRKGTDRIDADRRDAGGVNWIRVGIEAGVLLAAGIGLAATLALAPDLREGLAALLGYGWAAVGVFGIATLLLLAHRPAALLRGWRWWLAAGIATVGVIIALSVVPGANGAQYDGMAGRVGWIITGNIPVIAIIEGILGLALIGLLVAPGASRKYWAAVKYSGIGLWKALWVVGISIVWAMRMLLAAVAVVGRGIGRLAGRRRSAGPADASAVAMPPAAEPDFVMDDAPAAAAYPEPSAAMPTPLSVNSRGNGWQLPPLDILAPAEPHRIDNAAISAMSEEIKEALAEHNVYVAVEDVKAGPRVIRFGLVPGYVPQRPGKDGEVAKQRPSRVRVGDIAKRQKDLALALKSPYIRIIETPEPGEGLVGLEVPNPSPGKVLMRSIVEHPAFGKIVSKGGLAFALGEDAGGASLVLDLAAMPHILIAGATGSGKSVCINSLVASLLMTRPPDELRMIMVDPKRVELTPFNGIPHLVTPVIVEPDEVQPALRGLINEMTRRYKMMEELGVRNIAGYNGKAPEPMSFLVLIVDELADLMMTGGLEVEQQLVRLAQLGRAAGIHMVLATQRPSVKVVTGLLKANVPARVAFAVASQVDSRVILDSGGAEGLMGKGDLLLLNNDFPKARRGQGTLVYDEEMDALIDFWRNQQGPPLPRISLDDDDEPSGGESGGSDAGGGDGAYGGNILDQARELALRNPRLTSAMVERRFKIRKSQADEIIEELRDEGLVIGG